MRKIEIPHCGAFALRDGDDTAKAQAVQALIAEGPDPFGRDPRHDHITGSAFVFSADRQKLLLTHHRKLDRWLQLGGHCDGVPDPRRTARREALEESGLSDIRPLSADIVDIDIHTIPAGREPEHRHFDLRYAFEADCGVPLVISSESKDLRWVLLAELEQFTAAASVLRARDVAARFS